MLPDSQERAEKQLVLLKKQIAQRKEVEEALRRESAIVKLLQEVAVAANEARTAEAAFQFTLDRVCAFTGWPLGHVCRLSADTGKLLSSSIWHCDGQGDYSAFKEMVEARDPAAGSGWLDEVLGSGKPVWVMDVREIFDFGSGQDAGLKTGFAFPVLAGSKVVAILEFFSLEEVQPDGDLLAVVAHIGTQLGRVAERVQAQEQLRESQALLAEAERMAHLGSWQWDFRQDRITWSAEMYRICGLRPGEFQGSLAAFLERVHPDERRYAREVLESALANRAPCEFFPRIVRPDGEVRLLQGWAQPVFDEAGELIRMVGTGQDVTDLKRTEEKLEHTAQQLTALNEMGQTVTASLDLEVVFDRVLTRLRSLLRAEGIFILLLEGDELVFAATDEVGEGSLKGQRVSVSTSVAGEVVHTGQPVWMYGDKMAQRAYRHIEATTGYRPAALLATPLRLHGEWIGVIEAVHSQPDAFDADDLRLLEAAAAWTATAIGNAHLFAAQQRARHTAEVMRNANQDLTQSLDLDSVLGSLLEHLEELTGYDQAAILMLERNSQLRVRSVRGHEAERLLQRRLQADAYPQLHRLLNTQQSLAVADVRQEKDWQALPGFPEGTRSYLGVLLQVSGHVVGLCLMEKASPGFFSRRHQLLAESLAGQAAIALQNAQLYSEVRSSRERLRYLTRKVISAQEEERRRVSRELHDQAGQALTALKLSLEMIKNELPQELERPREMLAEAVELSAKTMKQMRMLAHDLRPPVLDTFSLNSALDGLCREFEERAQLSISYQGVELPNLPDPVTISFYRFLQEALTNVVKYAEAVRVQVILDVVGETIRLVVTDDGQGFPVGEEQAANKGIGLVGAQERFELLGGQLAIDSAPGRGTRLTAYVPLEPYQR